MEHVCAGCGEALDQGSVLQALGKEWHTGCLKCADCGCRLEGKLFERAGQVHCECHYMHTCLSKCTACNGPITSQVMSANENMYHPACFKCVRCQSHIQAGETFALKGLELYCKRDYDRYLAHNDTNNGSAPTDQKQPAGPMHADKKRTRTTITDEQLGVLRKCFEENHTPDLQQRMALASATGLSPRVIQVWFQNRRAKEKKRDVQDTKPTMLPQGVRRPPTGPAGCLSMPFHPPPMPAMHGQLVRERGLGRAHYLVKVDPGQELYGGHVGGMVPKPLGFGKRLMLGAARMDPMVQLGPRGLSMHRVQSLPDLSRFALRRDRAHSLPLATSRGPHPPPGLAMDPPLLDGLGPDVGTRGLGVGGCGVGEDDGEGTDFELNQWLANLMAPESPDSSNQQQPLALRRSASLPMRDPANPQPLMDSPARGRHHKYRHQPYSRMDSDSSLGSMPSSPVFSSMEGTRMLGFKGDYIVDFGLGALSVDTLDTMHMA